MERTPLLETKNLKKYFDVAGGKLHAVDDVSIQIYEGETLGVVVGHKRGDEHLTRLIVEKNHVELETRLRLCCKVVCNMVASICHTLLKVVI